MQRAIESLDRRLEPIAMRVCVRFRGELLENPVEQGDLKKFGHDVPHRVPRDARESEFGGMTKSCGPEISSAA